MKTVFKLEYTEEDQLPRKSQYRTKQMMQLLEYLKSIPGEHVTVNDICDHFKQEGISVGITTIYRQLEKMVEHGEVAKYIVDGTSSACFEYIGHDHEETCVDNYHCKCEKCGKLIHLKCSEVKQLEEHILKEHRFKIDSRRTIFYGICEECQEN